MHMGYKNLQAEYVTDGSKFESVNEEKDLGVIISDDLKWEKPCSAAVSKANKILGMIKRSFSDKSKEIVILCIKVWSGLT